MSFDPAPQSERRDVNPVVGFVVMLAIGFLIFKGCGGGDQAGAERTVYSDTPVCGYDYSDPDNCSNEVKCRASGGTQEIYLPVGSAETGTEGWEWTEDQSGRCDPSEAPPEPAPMSAVEERCLAEVSAAIDQAQATGVDENSLISQRCLDLGF